MSRILKYNEAKFHILRLIKDRELRQNDRLPPERELARMFGVSIISIRRALLELQNAGMIDRRHGVGSFYTGHLEQDTFRNTLAIVSVDDFRFPSGEDMNTLRNVLLQYNARFQVFNVKSAVDVRIGPALAQCDRIAVSGFVNPQWLDFLFSHGKPLVQIGVSEQHAHPVCQVRFNWESALDRSIAALKKRGRKRIGLLLIHPASANCSYERRRLFLEAMHRHGLKAKEAHVRFTIIDNPLTHVEDYMARFGEELDALLIDYHVFNLWSFACLKAGLPLRHDLVIMQTRHEFRDEFNHIPGVSQLYFPDIMEAVVRVLYTYPFDFVDRKRTLMLEPVIEGELAAYDTPAASAAPSDGAVLSTVVC